MKTTSYRKDKIKPGFIALLAVIAGAAASTAVRTVPAARTAHAATPIQIGVDYPFTGGISGAVVPGVFRVNSFAFSFGLLNEEKKNSYNVSDWRMLINFSYSFSGAFNIMPKMAVIDLKISGNFYSEAEGRHYYKHPTYKAVPGTVTSYSTPASGAGSLSSWLGDRSFIPGEVYGLDFRFIFDCGNGYNYFVYLSGDRGEIVSYHTFNYEIPEWDFPEIPLPPEPELEHHAFAGWYYDASFTLPYDNRPIYEHTELYAKFIPLIYRISFITGVPALAYSDVNVTALTAAGALPAPGRKGYQFTGWYLDAELTKPYEPVMSMTCNITVYAGWEQITFTVTFYVNGAVYAVLNVPFGTTLHEAASMVNSGTTVISAMYADENKHDVLSINSYISSDMNVYAEVDAGSEVLPHGSIRNWFSRNWPYFPVAAGGLLTGAAITLIILKRKDIL